MWSQEHHRRTEETSCSSRTRFPSEGKAKIGIIDSKLTATFGEKDKRLSKPAEKTWLCCENLEESSDGSGGEEVI